MTPEPFHEPTHARVAKLLVITVIAIGVAVSAFSLSAHLTDSLGLSVPAANMCLSALVVVAGLVLSTMAIRGGGTWAEVAGFIVPAVVAALVAYRFGMPGVFLLFFLAYLVFLVHKATRAKRTS